MKFADLHLHTQFSDGTFSPEELVAQAGLHDLAAVALTDHDTVEGCARAALASRVAGIDFIPGTELTADQEGHELHVLGYCLDIQNPRLLAEIAHFQTVRQNRIREMVARLQAIRVPLEAQSVFDLANCRSPGRPHVARALVKAGLCANLDEALGVAGEVGRIGGVAEPAVQVGGRVGVRLGRQWQAGVAGQLAQHL